MGLCEPAAWIRADFPPFAYGSIIDKGFSEGAYSMGIVGGHEPDTTALVLYIGDEDASVADAVPMGISVWVHVACTFDDATDTVEFFGLEEKAIHPVPAGTVPPAPGTIKPLRWATPGPDGRIVTGVLGRQEVPEMLFKAWDARFERAQTAAPAQPSAPPVAGLGKTWLLVWWTATNASAPRPGQMGTWTLRLSLRRRS